MAGTLVRSVCRAMERIAPLRLAENWDNPFGTLRAESPVQDAPKKNVLLTIDLTTSVCAEALEKNAAVIVSYHPPIFKALRSLTLMNPLQASILRCAAEGTSIYTPHTALDSVWGGVNDWLAEGVLAGDKGNVHSLIGDKISAEGINEGGEGRLVTMDEPIEMGALEDRIKKHLNLAQLQVGYASSPKSSRLSPVRTIAICAGSGGSMLVGTQADVYFTGEMSHHEVLASVAAGKHVILCGHTNTERGYLPVLAKKLRNELQHSDYQAEGLAGIEVIVSQNDQHPLRFV